MVQRRKKKRFGRLLWRDCQGSWNQLPEIRTSNTFNIYGKAAALSSDYPQPFVLTTQMEAKNADGSHQDICHFVPTACILGDKASSPMGTRKDGCRVHPHPHTHTVYTQHVCVYICIYLEHIIMSTINVKSILNAKC